MDIPRRFGVVSDSDATTNPHQTNEWVETASRYAHEAGRGLAMSRQWIESEAIGKRPLTTLGVAFGLGVFAGWLIKRR